MGQALRPGLDLAGGNELAVDILVAVMRRVERGWGFAGNKIINIAVGVGAPAPSDQIGLKITL